MSTQETIAAIASAPGRAVRALVRISGPSTGAALDAVAPGRSERAGRARVRLGAGLDLACLVMEFSAPRSYTGEDAAELIIPGNPALAERVLGRLLEVPGVRLARPGEFTAKAYLNGRLTLERGEAVGAIIAARTAEELDAARRIASGAIGTEHRRWADELTTLLALVEAGIDFTDQEGVVAITPEELGVRLAALADGVREHVGAGTGREVHDSLARVVLAGAPNAGKSTLFNALLGRRRAVESPVAGTTRDALAERLDLSRETPGGGEVMLVDLAGLDGGGSGLVEAAAQEVARSELANADVVVHCDPLGRFESPGVDGRSAPTIRVRTKADLPLASGAAVAEGEGIAVCALDGWNLRTLKRAIADQAFGASDAGAARVTARQRRALLAALAAIEAAGAIAPAAGLQPELVAARLREGADAMGDLVGKITVEEVLGRVFATFCVGK